MSRISDIYMFYQQEVKTISLRQRVAGVQNLPAAVHNAFTALQAYVEGQGAMLAGMPFCCYYNQDLDDIDVEFGFPIDRQLPAKGELKSSIIPAGKYVRSMYMGAYEAIEPFYNEVYGWVAANKLTPLGMMYEFYYNSPENTPAERLLTEMMIPIS